MVKLEAINWDNFWRVIKITPKHTQTAYVQTVSVFLAQSYINLKAGYPDTSMAIYDDKCLVGFTKIVYVPKNVPPYHLKINTYMIDAVIIDEKYQGKGYGKQALEEIIEHIKNISPKVTEHISLVCYDENHRAINLFKSFGFTLLQPYNQEKCMSIYIKMFEK